jgi:hypothetical protein
MFYEFVIADERIPVEGIGIFVCLRCAFVSQLLKGDISDTENDAAIDELTLLMLFD